MEYLNADQWAQDETIPEELSDDEILKTMNSTQSDKVLEWIDTIPYEYSQDERMHMLNQKSRKALL